HPDLGFDVGGRRAGGVIEVGGLDVLVHRLRVPRPQAQVVHAGGHDLQRQTFVHRVDVVCQDVAAAGVIAVHVGLAGAGAAADPLRVGDAAPKPKHHRTGRVVVSFAVVRRHDRRGGNARVVAAGGVGLRVVGLVGLQPAAHGRIGQVRAPHA